MLATWRTRVGVHCTYGLGWADTTAGSKAAAAVAPAGAPLRILQQLQPETCPAQHRPVGQRSCCSSWLLGLRSSYCSSRGDAAKAKAQVSVGGTSQPLSFCCSSPSLPPRPRLGHLWRGHDNSSSDK